MTSRQVELVQTTWAKVVPIADEAAKLFYSRLFELDPELRPLFKTSIQEQGKKLMQMITVAVRGLGDLDKLVPAVQDLGARHAGYGVRRKDYETVGAALLWTLDQGLGEAFTPEVEEAWFTVYNLLATTMQSGAPKEAVAAA